MTNTKPIPAEQVEWLKSRSTHLIEPKELEARIAKGPLEVKFGVDPTTPHLHLGHMVPVWILKKLQEWGHHITIVVGDFTAYIGDPSGQVSERPALTHEEISANLASYKEQIGKVLDVKRVEFKQNASWLSKLSMDSLFSTAKVVPLSAMTQREDFKKRERVTLAEGLYSTLVGLDSVHLKSDLELGGLDQLLNLMASRDLMRAKGMEPESILTTPMLLGTTNDGRKMSKSFGNAINVEDEPNNMFGKVMSVPDAYLPDYFFLATELPESQWKELVSSKPRDAKLLLAKTIVTTYHSATAAERASKHWNATFSEHRIPTNLQLARAFASHPSWTFVLSSHTPNHSNTQARKLIDDGAVDIFSAEGAPEGTLKHTTPFPRRGENKILKIGKRRFIRIAFI
jgi:tyrosyl-tRNA synthetase